MVCFQEEWGFKVWNIGSKFENISDFKYWVGLSIHKWMALIFQLCLLVGHGRVWGLRLSAGRSYGLLTFRSALCLSLVGVLNCVRFPVVVAVGVDWVDDSLVLVLVGCPTCDVIMTSWLKRLTSYKSQMAMHVFLKLFQLWYKLLLKCTQKLHLYGDIYWRSESHIGWFRWQWIIFPNGVLLFFT